jgi:hypothetical protein
MRRFPVGNLALVILSTEHRVVVYRQETPRQRDAPCSTQVA